MKQRAIYFGQYVGIRALRGCARLLPWSVRGRVLGALGGVVVRFVPSFRKRAEAGLMRVYPDMPAGERLVLVRAVGCNTAHTLTELMFNAEFAKTLKDVSPSGPGLAALQEARVNGQGAVIVSAHFGAWEAIRHVLKARGIEVGAVYRPNNNPYYEPLFVQNVEEGGKPLVPKGTSGTKAMVRHLRKGGFMAILADQKYGEGVLMDFMGHAAMTSTAPAELALKYGLVLVPAYATRTKQGLDIDFEAPILLSNATQMTQAINDSISDRIHAHPDQWHWLHQRWGQSFKS